jgi:hypothetical protein
LVVGSGDASGDRAGLAVCLFSEPGGAHVRNPDLDWT